MFRAKQPTRRTKVNRALVAAGLCLTGIGTLAGTAIAAEPLDGPEIQVTLMDSDIIGISGRGFAANEAVSVQAKSDTSTGVASVTATTQGRILLGFAVPGDITSTTEVVVTATGASGAATGAVDVPAQATTTTTTAPPTTTTTIVQTSNPGSTPGLSNKLSGIEGAYDFNDRLAIYKKLKARSDKDSAQLKQLLTSTSATADIQTTVKAITGAQKALDTTVAATNAAVLSINAAADTAQDQAGIDALEPSVNALSDMMDLQISSVKTLISVQEKAIRLLSATGTTSSTTTIASTSSTTTNPSALSSVPTVPLTPVQP